MANTLGTVAAPAALDDSVSLLNTANNATTTLSDNPLTSGATTVNVASTTGFPATNGSISIDAEIIYYAGTTSTSFTGCLRGQDGTAAASHTLGAAISAFATSGHRQLLRDAVIAAEGPVIGPIWYNVKAYGARGDGATDDTTAIQNAINAANTAGGGLVYFPPGIFMTGTLTTYEKVHIAGVGIETTIIQLKAGAVADIFKTRNFDTLTTTNPSSGDMGAWNFSIQNLTIDGNKANDAAASTTITDNPLTAVAAVVNLTNATSFPTAGRARIVRDSTNHQGSEIIAWTGKTGNQLTGVTRGLDGTTAAAHVTGTAIILRPTNTNNAAVPVGCGIKIYGYGYVLHNVRIRNCRGDGVYTEWSNFASAPASGDGMEAHFANFKVHDCDGNGIHNAGPHDSMISNWQSFLNALNGIYVRTNGNGFQINNGHTWGVGQGYGIVAEGNVYLNNAEAEGADIGQVWLRANDCVIEGGNFYGYGLAGQKGFIVGPTTAAATIAGTYISAKVLSCLGGGLDVTNDAGGSEYAILNFQASGTGLIGSLPSTDQGFMQTTGGATGGDFSQLQCDFSLWDANSNPNAAGNLQYHRLLALSQSTGQLVVGGFRASQKFTVVQGSTVDTSTVDGDIFNINTVSKFIEIPNSSFFRFYSDTYGTLVAQIDGSNGNQTLNGTLSIGDGVSGLSMPVGGTLSVNATPVTATNPSAAANLMSLSIPAGALNVAGRTIRIRGAGIYTTASSQTPTVTIAVKLGTVTLATFVSTATVGSTTNAPWGFELDCTTVATGTSGTLESHGELFIRLTAANAAAQSFLDSNTAVSAAVNLTTAETLQVTVLLSSSSATNTVSQRQMTVELLN